MKTRPPHRRFEWGCQIVDALARVRSDPVKPRVLTAAGVVRGGLEHPLATNGGGGPWASRFPTGTELHILTTLLLLELSVVNEEEYRCCDRLCVGWFCWC